jgi:hypothetical protein
VLCGLPFLLLQLPHRLLCCAALQQLHPDVRWRACRGLHTTNTDRQLMGWTLPYWAAALHRKPLLRRRQHADMSAVVVEAPLPNKHQCTGCGSLCVTLHQPLKYSPCFVSARLERWCLGWSGW